MKRLFQIGFCLLLIFAFTAQAFAAASTFTVQPFKVNGPQGYAYLERSVPQMLTSRLYWKGRVEPLQNAGGKADYVISGTVNVVGQDCSIDVLVTSKSGQQWRHSGESRANQFMTAIKVVSDSINRDVFNRMPESIASAKTSGGKRVNQMNPDIVVNETTAQDVYLNPQFRYAGVADGDDSRLRSQTLPFTSIGMEVCDADGDGRNELFILADSALYAYQFAPGKATQIGQFSLPKSYNVLSLRAMPSSGGRSRLIVNMVNKDKMPMASVFTFDGRNFTEESKNIKYFLNVVKLAPDYIPTLVGQQAQPPRLFHPDVYEMVKTADGYATGRRLNLPKEVNVFNFMYLPGRADETGSDKIIMLTKDERLRVYNDKGNRMSETEEAYSGSSKGMEVSTSMAGMNEDKVTLKDMFYIPLRMLAVDFDRDGKYEVLVNRPMSTASKIFDRYRFFPQSEIHSLFWDGLGLNLQWKTRRIKGSVSDFTVADLNNDGILDLVTCINTHPGALGAQARKTVIMAYPLDLTRTNPNTSIDSGEYSAD